MAIQSRGVVLFLNTDVVIAPRPYGEVGCTVTVEVAQSCDRDAKMIVIIQYAREAALDIADLLLRLDLPVSL